MTQAARDLRESELEYRTLVEHSPDVIARFDRRLRHVYVNTAVEGVTGINKEEFLGKTNRDVGMPEDLCDVWDARILSVFRTGESSRIRFPFPSPTKGRLILESLLVPERDDAGGVDHVLSIVQDVTEKSRTEEKIRRLNRRLKDQSKRLREANQELRAFSSSVSHALRAPLRAVKGFSAALLEDASPRLDEKDKVYLNRIIRAGRTMEELIDSLLDFAYLRETDIQPKIVDLSSLAKDIAADLKAGQPGRRVEFVIQEDISVAADPRLMEIVLQNLFRNAWKFTAAAAEARIEFGSTNQDPNPCLYVRDNGVGFNMAYAHKLFQPFQRLHSASDFPGSGIGLAMVRRILGRHDGKIWVQSEVGRGTTFYFTLGV